MELVKCTAVDKTTVYVNPAMVVCIHDNPKGYVEVMLVGAQNYVLLTGASSELLVERFNVVLRGKNA